LAENSLARWSLFAFKVFCATVIAITTAFTVYVVGPVIETRFFPVVSKLTINSLGRSPEGYAVVSAEFTKLRDCEYIGLAWFRGTPSTDFERVPVIIMRQPGDTSGPTRPVGRQRSGPWIVHMPPEEIRGNSFAQLHHRCHGFWLTTTAFYP
jgi:hypothetical protein